MKPVFFWIVTGVISFAILVGIIFTVLVLLEPPDEKLVVQTIEGDKVLATQMIEQKQKEINRLSAELDSLRKSYNAVVALKDSIQEQLAFKDNIIEQYKKMVENLNAEINEKQKVESNIKELARTYESMKVEELKGILSKLDDRTVLMIYQNVSPRNKKNILSALGPTRAASLTQRLVQIRERSNS